MAKLKTVQAGGQVHRIFGGQMRVCSVDDKKNYTVELMLLNEITNENNWRYTRVAEHTADVENIPILYSVINGKVGNSHDFEIVTTDTGKQYASFIGAESEHPYGWIPQTIKGRANAQMKNINGIEWLTATGYLPHFYNTEMIEELEKNGGQMPISIETLVTKYHMEGKVEVEEEYSIMGVTILGVTTKPAVVGANIRKVALNNKSLEELKLRVASLANASNTEPQTQIKTKKMKENTMKVKTLDDLKPAFKALGYTAVKVKGQTVALLSDTGHFCTYTYLGDEDTIIKERIAAVTVNSTFGEGENAITVSADELVGSLITKLNATDAALKEQTKKYAEDTEALNQKLNKMLEDEAKRRKEAVKEAIKSQLAENQKDCAVDINSNLCDDMLMDEAIDKYAKMEENGIFMGDTAARREVDSRCMAKVREAQKARQNAAKTKFSWGTINNNPAQPSSDIDALVNKYE